MTTHAAHENNTRYRQCDTITIRHLHQRKHLSARLSHKKKNFIHASTRHPNTRKTFKVPFSSGRYIPTHIIYIETCFLLSRLTDSGAFDVWLPLLFLHTNTVKNRLDDIQKSKRTLCQWGNADKLNAPA